MIPSTLMAIALAVATLGGLTMVNGHDVATRRGQAIADAVALAGVVGGVDAATEVARRNASTLMSIDWSGAERSSTVTVEVLVDGDGTFRSDAIGG